LCLQQEKVSEKLQYNLIQERWWLMLWVTKETKKSSFAFYIPGNSKKLLGWCTLKNVPMVLCIWKRWSKRLIGDKFNPYMSEVKELLVKVVNDKGVQFTIESCIPIVYESTIQLPVVV
jgi:hypothetical protein